MTSSETQTHTEGPTLRAKDFVSSMDFVQLCKNLAIEFGEGNVFLPEADYRGGIRWETWPGDDMNSRTYKSMIINVHGHYGSNGVKCVWPSVSTMSVMKEWEANDFLLIRPSKVNRIMTHLRAFRGAPVWTVEELRKFKKCFKTFGLEMGKLPLKRDLTSKSDY